MESRAFYAPEPAWGHLVCTAVAVFLYFIGHIYQQVATLLLPGDALLPPLATNSQTDHATSSRIFAS